jgi:quercetin dioxygenase-like cupin family protein
LECRSRAFAATGKTLPGKGLIMILRPAIRTQITRRELQFALLGAFLSGAATALVFCLTVGPATVRAQTQVMHSTVFDWNTFTVKPTAVGSTRSVVSAPTATLENLEIHITTLNPGQMPHPPHRHPNEELVLIDQGTVEAFNNGVWKRVGPGSIIFNASNEVHGLRNVGTTPAQYHVINVKTAATPPGETVVVGDAK